MDNFELAKKQLKLETEGEIRVDNAYQGLYKQMVELFRGLGLEATPGAPRGRSGVCGGLVCRGRSCSTASAWGHAGLLMLGAWR